MKLQGDGNVQNPKYVRWRNQLAIPIRSLWTHGIGHAPGQTGRDRIHVQRDEFAESFS